MTGIGIIGCGGISRFHHEGFARAGARIAHVCDLRRDAAERVAATYGARATLDYRAVLDDPAVELVSVTTSAASHRDICLAAVAAGKGVVCEKTLTDGPAGSWEVARDAEAAGVFCATAYMKRFFPAAQRAKKLLEGMGRIISVYARSWQPSPSWNAPIAGEWMAPPSIPRRNYGGGALVCAGSHILDLLNWIAGRPAKLSGQMLTRDGMDFDVQANALLWFEAGGVAHFEACWHPLKYVGYERNGWDERLEINTDGGRLELYTVTWNQPTHNGALLVHHDAESGEVTEFRYPAVNPFDIEMAEMLRCFQAREPASPSARDGYVVDEIIAHITESARTGHTLDIAWRDRAEPRA